jgi:hypothetical protein
MPIHDDLIVAVDFNGDVSTVAEYASAVRTGALNGDASITASGHEGDGLQVQGSGSLVFPTWSALRQQQISIACWLYLPQLPSVAGGSWPKVLIQRGDGATSGYSLRIESGDVLTFSIVDLAFSIYTASYVLQAGDVGRWLAIVGAQDGDDIRLYLDGVEVGSGLVDGLINNSLTEDLVIGENLDGTLDEIMIWGRGLQTTGGTDPHGNAINEIEYATDDGSGRFYPLRGHTTDPQGTVYYLDQQLDISERFSPLSNSAAVRQLFTPTVSLAVGSSGTLPEWALSFAFRRSVATSSTLPLLRSDDAIFGVDLVEGGIEVLFDGQVVPIACDQEKVNHLFLTVNDGMAWASFNGEVPVVLSSTAGLAFPLVFTDAGFSNIKVWGALGEHRTYYLSDVSALPDAGAIPLVGWWKLQGDGVDAIGGDDATVTGAFETFSDLQATPEVYRIYDSFAGIGHTSDFWAPILYTDSPFFLSEWPRNPYPEVESVDYRQNLSLLELQGTIGPTDTPHINYYWEIEVKPGKLYMHVHEERLQDPSKYSLTDLEVNDALYLPEGYLLNGTRVRLVVTATDGRSLVWASSWVAIGEGDSGEPPEGPYKALVVVNVYDWSADETFELGRVPDIVGETGGDYTWSLVKEGDADSLAAPAIVDPKSTTLRLSNMRSGRFQYRITGQWTGGVSLRQDFVLLVREDASGNV